MPQSSPFPLALCENHSQSWLVQIAFVLPSRFLRNSAAAPHLNESICDVLLRFRHGLIGSAAALATELPHLGTGEEVWGSENLHRLFRLRSASGNPFF